MSNHRNQCIPNTSPSSGSAPLMTWLDLHALHFSARVAEVVAVFGGAILGHFEKASTTTRKAELTIISFSAKEIPTTDPVDLTEVILLQELLKLQEMNSPGPDGIHVKLLQELAVELAEHLYLFFRAFLNTSQFPPDWKTAWTSPINKIVSRASANNYRPNDGPKHSMKEIRCLQSSKTSKKHSKLSLINVYCTSSVLYW
ncbi:unnamed protein product [Dibothriocephalus latus]|uniref:Reverse transcriptase domain-containing protein n=1 Tax=Dibothriocephalus latus TaxID=60516 RepID=A0A3P7LNV7_DIBLA|nr:unnamed protein product [Dibothriocephalus latus]